MPTERHRLADRLNRATAQLDPPFAVVDLAAFDANAVALARLAGGKPVRAASKSIRCRALLRRALSHPGWHGVMAYTLAEALWLAHPEPNGADPVGGTDPSDGTDRAGGADPTSSDVLVAYPTADRGALVALAADPRLAAAITLMVDAPAQLDLIDSVVEPAGRPEIRICLDLDASWRPLRGGPGGRLHVGVRRSPIHSPTGAGELAELVAARPGFRLVGLMAYEAQIAGLGDAPPGQAARGAVIRALQRRSYRDLVRRRGAATAAVRAHADLAFVNGGGTGSVAATCADPAVTEVTAGSGLYGPTLFDGYRAWRPTPSAYFALPVVRRPAAGVATVLGGGWIASGPTGPSRQPTPWLPAGLRLTGAEGAGEVQTPLVGAAADRLRVGDRVWFRHAKAGELCEHVAELHLVDGDRIVATVPTYRGEGRTFL